MKNNIVFIYNIYYNKRVDTIKLVQNVSKYKEMMTSTDHYQASAECAETYVVKYLFT